MSKSSSSSLVSVVIPTYNRGDCIERTIDSALGQTHQNVEILVVDDGSTDDTRQRIERRYGLDARVRYLHQQNQGVSAARNTGLQNVRGDFVALLDSDDVWMPWNEPKRESGVHSLVVQLMTLEPGLFPFVVVDYDTHEGIDIIVKGNDAIAVHGLRLYYVEFKYFISAAFNHSFENLHSIVCWDTELKHGDIVKDINREERKLSVAAPCGPDDYTRYFLENPRKAHRIEVFVLKDYLRQKLKVEFRPRTATDVQ